MQQVTALHQFVILRVKEQFLLVRKVGIVEFRILILVQQDQVSDTMLGRLELLPLYRILDIIPIQVAIYRNYNLIISIDQFPVVILVIHLGFGLNVLQ